MWPVPDELILPLALVGLLAGWFAHTRVTYRWRAAHRRAAEAPRHRVGVSRAPAGRAEPRRHQEDHRLDPDVLKALERLEQPSS